MPDRLSAPAGELTGPQHPFGSFWKKQAALTSTWGSIASERSRAVKLCVAWAFLDIDCKQAQGFLHHQ